MSEEKGWKEIPIGGMIEEAGSSAQFKTGDWKVFRPIIDDKKCIHCMICVINCPEYCIKSEGDEKNIKRREVDLDYCKGCGICANVCPVKCITMEEDSNFTK